MNDNEIIKALECCNTAKTEQHCADCPFYLHEKCTVSMLDEAVDLINRQKAEIEGWKEAFNNLDKIARPNLAFVEKAKAEAIREFAEKLKTKLSNLEANSPDSAYKTAMEDMKDYFVPKVIDNLAKEMVGGDNDKL